ncbi:MAG: Extracellular ligand-binding receptor [Candidatus Taylorbacteria bacterium]|nr:Extracellular ligand-binding receptor [Candidatus Taylorbacteria bacterium]
MNKKILGAAALIILIILGVWASKHTSAGKQALNIGVISTLTGQASYIGESTMKGAELGKIKALNEHPNLPVNLFHEDSLFTPKGGIDAYNKLRQTKNISAVISMASNVSVAIEPLAIKAGVLDIAVSTLATAFSTPNDLTFRITSKANTEAAPAIEYLKSHGKKKLGIMYMNNEIGVSLRDALKKSAEGSGISVVAEEGFPADSKEFNTILLKMKQAGVDSIYLASLASHSSVILAEAANLKIQPVFVSYRGAEDPALVKEGTAKLAENLVYTNAYDSNATDSINASFVKAYQEKYHELPNGYAAEAYEAVRLIADAYAKCGSVIQEDSMPNIKATDCTKSFLSSIRLRESLFGPLSFDKNGDVSYAFFMKTVRDGKFVRLEK